MSALQAAGPGREAQLAEALAAVQARLEQAAHAAGRRVTEIELLPITKFFPATDVAILSRLGCRSVGESREQEASAKVQELQVLHGRLPEPVHWHMVGQIQRNKARSLAGWAHTVHSVSSSRTLTALDRAVGQALDEGRRTAPLRVYIQVSLDADVSRGGVDIAAPGAIVEICGQVEAAGALQLVGLMGIPPLDADPDVSFERLAVEHRRVLDFHPGALGLSAGMSSDLEIAVKHGSTCVRVGTALMSPRRLTSP